MLYRHRAESARCSKTKPAILLQACGYFVYRHVGSQAFESLVQKRIQSAAAEKIELLAALKETATTIIGEHKLITSGVLDTDPLSECDGNTEGLQCSEGVRTNVEA
jgi:hypothetical protein